MGPNISQFTSRADVLGKLHVYTVKNEIYSILLYIRSIFCNNHHKRIQNIQETGDKPYNTSYTTKNTQPVKKQNMSNMNIYSVVIKQPL